ncbi:MIP/aquaporin family protein [Levilactobacillus brevis]|uniref:Glycerol uptake facilitator related permease n=4 Tax=Levilactobacillus brevis TaxID=1580 RepID=Q03P21_LEVBA|nr:aquaporin [Levilactobacillus brevis]MBL3537244.1 aquaporin [Lactobacillus sp. GPR40-2]MBL3630511.1 aquaporin [Lactobacillus sp. GPB7-4]ABJ65051.1 Glycerol uptake facilitator related permease [Levilactobacillus brevis ATCC 367]ANN49872.1 aquaporin [Levilactobacillus brevis]ARQ92640.1 aquaporin [Levilactobacillus brevis]
MQKYLAEFFGTFMLVFLGTGAVTVAAGNTLTIGLAFGLAITVSAYAFGGISGGHFNPAVTTAMLMNRRINGRDALGYVIAQVLGATVASAFMKLFVSGLGLATNQLGQTDFPKISTGLAFLVEVLVTFLFLLVILNVTSDRHGNGDFAGLTIGVTLAFLIIVALNLTGGSLNPARSFGPAIFAGGSALSHLWLYILAPEVGAILAALVARVMGSEE